MQIVRTVSPHERRGPRLAEEGWPRASKIAFDVDLWHPGTTEGAQQILDDLRKICGKHGGRIEDETKTSSLVLARVEGSRDLGEALLKMDFVARVELPARLGAEYAGLFEPIVAAPITARPAEDAVAVCVVDSGALSGHPLLQGWIIEEHDFGTTENNAADLCGHGTQVAGLVIYGDVAACITSKQWQPRVPIYSAKVLQRDGVTGDPVFPDAKRPERIVEDAIRYFNTNRGCRIFNLSLGSIADVYRGGRQFAWAEKLDQLARELDVVIVVSAGNRPVRELPIPTVVSTRTQFQEAIRDHALTEPTHRVCNPATAAVAVTVGAIARADSPRVPAALPGAPTGAPSPFSRVGPGYEGKETQRAVKPEFVAPGGNVAVSNLGSAAC
jgi:subtilisin family serine protease